MEDAKDNKYKRYRDRHPDKVRAYRESRRAEQAASRVANREKARAYGAAYREQHREESRQYSRAWAEANRQRTREKARAWQRANPERVNRNCRNRQASKLAVGRHTFEDVQRQRKEQGNRCFFCYAWLGTRYHVDHFVAIAVGGSNDPENLVIACPHCNISKAHRPAVLLFARLAGARRLAV